jgi:leader peptidase (prepilin peptidase)/N-methyltransferase
MPLLDLITYLFTAAFALVMGAAIGSFLNVVIYRIPEGLSIVHPPSRCPRCLNQLKAYDNVPVLGWLWLRGKCRFCKNPISIRYPLVEAFTALVFVATYIRFGWPLPTLGYWAFLAWLIALSMIDLDTMTLPEPLTRSGLAVGLGFQALLGGIITGSISGAIQFLMGGAIAAVLGILLFDAITILGSIMMGQTAMGGGDAKLFAMMGAWLGWKALLLSGFLACLMGAIIGGGGIALGMIDRRQPIPFGPFLAVGGAIALFAGDLFISTYLRIFFPALIPS